MNCPSLFYRERLPARWLLSCLLVLWVNRVGAADSPQITITGGSDVLTENVRQYLIMTEEGCSSPLWRLQSLLGESQDQIEKAAQAVGYYQLTFTSKLTQANDCWQLHIDLTPGEQVTITEVRVLIDGDGADDEIFKELIEAPQIKVGDKLNHGRYQNLKNRITNMASSHGYFDGRFDVAKIVVNTLENSAKIELIYNSNRRYKFGEIRITHGILDESFLRRYLNISSGDDYDTEKLLELKNIYNASNYFNVASVSPDIQSLSRKKAEAAVSGSPEEGLIDVEPPTNQWPVNSVAVDPAAVAPDTAAAQLQDATPTKVDPIEPVPIELVPSYEIPIDIVLEERKRRAYSIGLGVATDTGPRILLGFEDRYVNDSGHSVKADLTMSKTKTSGLVAYSIPMEQPFYEKLKIYTGYEREETDTTYSSKKLLGTSYTYYQKNKWLHTYAVDYERELSRISDGPFETTNLIIPSVAFLRKKTDGNPYTLAGWSLLGKLSGSPKTFGSDLSFIQFDARAKYIHALPIGRLLVRGELGLTQVNDFDELPASKRYFAGGDISVRGYGYESLGPKDAQGVVVGGNNLLVGSIEYDYLVRPKWALATFYDVGNAVDDLHADLKRSVGLGVRWISPIGPVRIDAARALDDEKGWMFHLTMGPDL